MDNRIDVEKFIVLYKNLIPKSQIMSVLNISDYMYYKIIDIYGLTRDKTCKSKRLTIALQQQQNNIKHQPIDIIYAPFNSTRNKIC